MAKVCTYEGEVSFVQLHPLKLSDALQGIAVSDVAAQSIHRIGRVDDNPTFAKALHHLLYLPLIGILRIYFDEFRHIFQYIIGDLSFAPGSVKDKCTINK